MPKNSTDATEAINRSFEPDEPQPTDNPSTECTEWVNDCMSEWYNA